MKSSVLLDSHKLLIDQFIRHCVLDERKDRLISLIQTEKGLIRLLEELDHFEKYLNIENALLISNFKDSSEVLSTLDIKGHENAFALSTIRGMKSGTEQSLSDLLTALYKVGNGSIICHPVVDPRSFFYLGEDTSVQLLWRLKNNEKSQNDNHLIRDKRKNESPTRQKQR